MIASEHLVYLIRCLHPEVLGVVNGEDFRFEKKENSCLVVQLMRKVRYIEWVYIVFEDSKQRSLLMRLKLKVKTGDILKE